MKKILGFLFVFLFFGIVSAADSTAVFHSDSMNNDILDNEATPVDVSTYVLFDNGANTSDTLATTDRLVIGPFPLTSGSRKAQFKYFNVLGRKLASGDSAAVAYQLSPTTAVADTSSWTTFDTLCAATGGTKTVVDLTTKTGKYIWFRVHNFTAGSIYIKNQWVLFRHNWLGN